MAQSPNLLLLAASLGFHTSCSRPPATAPPGAAVRSTASCDEVTPLSFDRSPGGTPDVAPEIVHAHLCELHVVDVRERHELVAEHGHIAGAEWVPLRELARQAEGWDPAEAWVLVDRSGRRSGRAAQYLADLGFSRVASMTGGMIAWERLGFPVSRDHDFGRPVEPWAPPPVTPGQLLTAEDVEIHVGDPRRVRWTKAATLLLQGTESCVDGRDDHAVVGTPGGDAGELLAALATAEALTGEVLRAGEVEELFGEYVEAFGHFYMHSDDHALHALAEALRRDPRFGEVHLTGRDAVEGLVRRPPAALQRALLERLVAPEAIGCGHLRLIRLQPDEYEVRPGLLEALLRAFFHRLWRGSDALEYVILEGEHAEAAVLEVRLEGSVEPFTAIPMIAPRHGDREVFVHHPEVASFVRRQNASFLLRRPGWSELDEGAFLAHLEDLAHRHLGHTVGYLAADLPVFEVRFAADRTFAVRPR